jgi:hypothetical protein
MVPWIETAIIASAISLSVDRVPAINVEPYCHDIATRAAPVGDVDSCKRVEQAARDQLVKEWGEFARPDKSHCLQLSSLEIQPTYTELLTCLELARDARKLREQESSTTGQ